MFVGCGGAPSGECWRAAYACVVQGSTRWVDDLNPGMACSSGWYEAVRSGW